jgi:hypothetical protein
MGYTPISQQMFFSHTLCPTTIVRQDIFLNEYNEISSNIQLQPNDEASLMQEMKYHYKQPA